MKRTLCIFLILLIALLPCTAMAADSSVCFIAINDDLLPLTSQAYSQGGQYYVPASVFSRLRIYSSYHAGSSTAELTGSAKQMFFNVETGEVTLTDTRAVSMPIMHVLNCSQGLLII